MTRTAALLVALALGGCATTGQIKPFASDGCSAVPDGNYCDCCYAHDLVYWRGGTAGQRLQADEDFRACLRGKTGGEALPALMYYGVRVGGHPAWPLPWRWAYGWPWGRGYEPLAAEETQVAQSLIERVDEAYPQQVCPRD